MWCVHSGLGLRTSGVGYIWSNNVGLLEVCHTEIHLQILGMLPDLLEVDIGSDILN